MLGRCVVICLTMGHVTLCAQDLLYFLVLIGSSKEARLGPEFHFQPVELV